jgi:mono/diheme cytochrome c family protein
MTRRTFPIFTAIVALTALGIFFGSAGLGQDQPSAAREVKADFSAIRPLLAKYCFSCHGNEKPKAGLNLEAFDGQKKPEDWTEVWDRVRSGQMPPSNRPSPTLAEKEKITSWIEGVFARHTLGGHRDPGPLRQRRLNAREYVNSVRGLA